MLNREKWSLKGITFALISIVFLLEWADLCFRVIQKWNSLGSYLDTKVSLFLICSMLLMLALIAEKCRLSTLAIASLLFWITSGLVFQMLVTPGFLTAH
jgi:hypothetical protein